MSPEIPQSPSAPLWRDIAVNAKEVSSREKKKARAQASVVFGVHDSPFGGCLLGVCEEGICHMSFFRSGLKDPMENFRKTWPGPDNRRDDEETAGALRRALFPSEDPPEILLLGTRFQLRVWESLLRVPKGETLCYSDLAESVGKPAAVRAVSNAVANNPVAYLVPCHRIVGKAGDLHGYRWGLAVKRTILECEGAYPVAVSGDQRRGSSLVMQ